MAKKVISVFMSLVLMLALCSCSTLSNDSSSSSDVSDEISITPEEEKISPTPVIPALESYDYSEYFDFDIPVFSDADNSGLDLIVDSEYGWCVEGQSHIQTTGWEQVFVDDSTAKELAAAIALAEANVIYSHRNFTGFSDISEADSEYLLYVSIISTPMINTADAPQENIVSKISDYLVSEYDLYPTEIYYADDVEKTFHYIFGDDAEFVPENLESFCYRYVPEAGIFLHFLESSAPDYTFPQITEYHEEDGKYYVTAVQTSAYDYDTEGNVFDNIDTDGFLENAVFTYVLERAKDGHLFLISTENG